MSPEEKVKYLTDLFYNLDRQQTSEWRIGRMSIKADGDISCPRESFLHADLQDDKFMDAVNQRELLHSEICLEYDPSSKEKVVAKREFTALIQRLKEDNIKFKAYGTEDFRALRVETFWDGLGQLNVTQRAEIRSYLIGKYNCDQQLASDKHQVSFGIHYKTNKPIEVIEEDAGMNSLKELRAELFEYKKSLIKEEIQIPGQGKLISKFAEELGNIFKDKNLIFFHANVYSCVVINLYESEEDKNKVFTGFKILNPNQFITLIERFCVPGRYVPDRENKDNYIFKEKSTDKSTANTVLLSSQFIGQLPRIQRIFSIPLPFIYKNKLTLPKKGYDERVKSWTPHSTPNINLDMSIEDAKKVIYELFSEFCFYKEQDRINAIAGLITPFLRGLYTSFVQRTPLFFYMANRERAGKDYLAGITGIVYEGYAIEEPPISTNENNRSNNNEELRKKILSSLIQGRKRLHFANNKGHINNSVLESIITNKYFSDRILGKNEGVTLPNELEFSMSGNSGVGYTPDFSARSIFITLFFDQEDPNSREFKKPNLHEWVLENRDIILSAIYSFVKHWFDKGKPQGSIINNSFPEWANICGGIMESVGIDNPCILNNDSLNIKGDTETTNMKLLFEIAYQSFGSKWVSRQDIKELVRQDEVDVLSYLNLDVRSDQIKFGNLLIKFKGRILSDIRLEIEENPRPSRAKLRFVKLSGNDGNDGNDLLMSEIKIEENNNIIKDRENITKTTNITKSLSEKIYSFIKEHPGSTLQDLIDNFESPNILKQQILKTIENLKSKGDIFEEKPDKWRVV